MDDKQDFQHSILAWFKQNSRNLPWRSTYSPYHVWISEIMLQQTQMERGVDYFNRWIEKFPDLKTLAKASEEEVLKLWEGLGYYSRARNILKTARILMDKGGEIPSTKSELTALPGIGRYTAAAILSIAFNQDIPVVDANVERLFARVFNISAPVKDKSTHDIITQKARELLPSGKARLFNQALMEMGALVCLLKRPLCVSCPIQRFCESYEKNIVDERPVPGKSTETLFIEMATGVLIHNDKVFIQKRPAHGVWANLWEFPGGRLEEGETPQHALIREYQEETGFSINNIKSITTIKHTYTRYKVTLHCYFCKLKSKSIIPLLSEAQEARWVEFDELDEFAFPSPHRKLIKLIKKGFYKPNSS